MLLMGVTEVNYRSFYNPIRAWIREFSSGGGGQGGPGQSDKRSSDVCFF